MVNVPASMRSGMTSCSAPCNRSGTRSFDLCTHLVEQVGEVGHFRFTRTVLQDRFSLGESGGHEQVFGPSHRDFVEDNLRALESVGFSLNIAVFLCDLGTELFQSLNVEIDRACADRASSGKGYVRASATCDQRSQH